MPLILGTNSIKDTGYNVANSCRFEGGDSPELKKTNGSAGNRKTWTFSAWIKRAKLGAGQNFFSGGDDGGNTGSYTRIMFNGDDDIYLAHIVSGSTATEKQTDMKFRDCSAWYHIVWVLDTTQGTASNREKLYVNGTQVTSFSTNTIPAEDFQTEMNNDSTMFVGNQLGTWEFCSLYMAEVCFIDGQALTPTSFGEFDEDSPTIWKPKDVSGLTFGTNGFYLDFEDSSNLGNDANGGTDLAEDNIAATDQATDTPTNNFATLNSLYKSGVTFAEGNTQADNQSSDWTTALSTIGVANGKWYAEFKVTDDASGVTRNSFGVCNATDGTVIAENELGYQPTGAVGDSVGFSSTAVHKNGSDLGWGNSYAVNDIISVALDCDNGAVYFAKNGTWENSGDPTSGASRTGAATITVGETYLIGGTVYNSTYQANFGSPSFAISSGNSDANGYGNMEFAVPANYYVLCSKNLAEFG